jgi:Flp pilus assembly protein TadD
MHHLGSTFRVIRIVTLFTIPFGSVHAVPAETMPHTVVYAFLETDAQVLGQTLRDSALARFNELATRFDDCRLAHREQDAAISCLRSVIDGDDAMAIAGNASTLRESTVTGLLLDNRGSCAALVALSMILDPLAWDAYVLRDHVLLRTTVKPPKYLELTDRGREVSARELGNRFGSQLDAAVIVNAPTFISYYLDNLAVRLAGDGRDTDAERLFRKNIKHEPTEARLRLNYGTFLLERGRLDDARRQLKMAARDGPKNPDAWTNLGVAYARLGKIDRATDCFERALKIDPSNQVARTNLAALGQSSTKPR